MSRLALLSALLLALNACCGSCAAVSLLPPAPSNVRCTSANSHGLRVEWDALPNGAADGYAATAATSPSARPVVLRSVEGATANATLLLDLLPGRTYYVAVRAHSAAALSVGWDWGASSAPSVACSTTADTRLRLQRLSGAAAHPTEAPLLLPGSVERLALWPLGPRQNAGRVDGSPLLDALTMPGRAFLAIAEAASGAHGGGEDARWQAVAAVDGEGLDARHELLKGLAPGMAYAVVAGAACRTANVTAAATQLQACGVVGDPYVLRTSRENTRFFAAYRISEYTFEADFLANHDAASIEAMGAYIMHGTPLTTATHWPGSTAADWTKCQTTLATVCPQWRGDGMECMKCAELNRPQIEAVCGNFTFHDDADQGFNVHFYCGIGWPESVIMNSTIGEYCVEDVPLPQVLARGSSQAAASPGWAQYVSCNSDETDYFGNKPRDPICICWVYDDRILSQQTLSQLQASCDFTNPEPYVNETLCTCGNSGAQVTPDNPSSYYVGKSSVYLPYGYWLNRPPPEKYSVSVYAGDNYSMPKAGRCTETQVIGTGCMWQRQPQAQLLYGSNLMAAGWNTAQVEDTPTNMTITLANIAAFKAAVSNLAAATEPRCCGC